MILDSGLLYLGHPIHVVLGRIIWSNIKSNLVKS